MSSRSSSLVVSSSEMPMVWSSTERKLRPLASAIRRMSGSASDATGHGALELFAWGKKGGVRTAITERDTETLGAADGNVRAKFSRRMEERQREEIGGDDDQCAGLMGLLDEGRVIVD